MRLVLFYSLVFMTLFSCEEGIDLKNIEQEGCLIYDNERLFNGSLIIRHENGNIQQKVNVDSGEINGSFETFDYSGGKLTHGKIIQTEKQGVYLKKWIEGPGTLDEKESIFFTIQLCRENMIINYQDSLYIIDISRSLKVENEKIGIFISDKQLKPNNSRYIGYNDFIERKSIP